MQRLLFLQSLGRRGHSIFSLFRSAFGAKRGFKPERCRRFSKPKSTQFIVWAFVMSFAPCSCPIVPFRCSHAILRNGVAMIRLQSHSPMQTCNDCDAEKSNHYEYGSPRCRAWLFDFVLLIQLHGPCNFSFDSLSLKLLDAIRQTGQFTYEATNRGLKVSFRLRNCFILL